MSIDAELMDDFLAESNRLVDECQELLEELEGDSTHAQKLSAYANKIDRVMGAAKSLAMLEEKDSVLRLIGDATGLCKALGYQGAKTTGNMYDVTVSFLLDATEIVKEMLGRTNESAEVLREGLMGTLLSRVKWINELYAKQGLSGVLAPDAKVAQNEIDALMKKLGG